MNETMRLIGSKLTILYLKRRKILIGKLNRNGSKLTILYLKRSTQTMFMQPPTCSKLTILYLKHIARISPFLT